MHAYYNTILYCVVLPIFLEHEGASHNLSMLTSV